MGKKSFQKKNLLLTIRFIFSYVGGPKKFFWFIVIPGFPKIMMMQKTVNFLTPKTKNVIARQKCFRHCSRLDLEKSTKVGYEEK